MKALALLVSFALLSSPLPLTAKEQIKSHKEKKQITKCTQKNPSKQMAVKQQTRLHEARFGNLTPAVPGGGGRNGLPNIRLDSFVLNSGGLSKVIYGNEGTSGPPPYFGFSQAAQNQSGIPLYKNGLNTAPFHENYFNRYDLRIGPSFWSDWKPLEGDFDCTLWKHYYRDKYDVAE
ncbi:MAG: hypothetical protein SFY67_07805 [Candidatus Melainabacteria bacterium]|nr:hypothetical protein [Candidatus Melainabacteria bacterium]